MLVITNPDNWYFLAQLCIYCAGLAAVAAVISAVFPRQIDALIRFFD